MKYLYLYLNIGSFLLPFIFSFHPKLKFYLKWRSLFSAIAIMMLFFISWDIIFTQNRIWGFNDVYLIGYKLFGLPIEEWLFFICIPYACIFTHYSLYHYFKKASISDKLMEVVYALLLVALILLLWFYYDRWYTFVNFVYALILSGFVYNYRKALLNKFFLSFLIILIPFFIVNGVLTGSGIEDQVVWYNDAENMGIRLLTIPIEDTIYAFSMILTVLVLTEFFEQKRTTH